MEDLRWFEHVADNKKSVIREMLSEAIDRLGGYQADLWSLHSLAERLNTIQAKVPREEFQLETAQSRLQCTHWLDTQL